MRSLEQNSKLFNKNTSVIGTSRTASFDFMYPKSNPIQKPLPHALQTQNHPFDAFGKGIISQKALKYPQYVLSMPNAVQPQQDFYPTFPNLAKTAITVCSQRNCSIPNHKQALLQTVGGKRGECGKTYISEDRKNELKRKHRQVSFYCDKEPRNSRKPAVKQKCSWEELGHYLQR